jgi:hypothetical protein
MSRGPARPGGHGLVAHVADPCQPASRGPAMQVITACQTPLPRPLLALIGGP